MPYTTYNVYRIIAQSGYWKYDHECHKTHQINRVCGTCYAHEFNLNAFRHEWSYIQYSRRAIDYYIYFSDENKRYSRKFRTASVTRELPVTWLSLHFWWKMTFNPSLNIRRFTINIYAWNQLKYTEDVYG